MVGYRIEHGVPIANTVNPATFWKVSERFGNYMMTGSALSTLANAQRVIINTANIMGYELSGWVQTASRSLVAMTTNGTFLKEPLFDRQSIVKGIDLYSQARAGARVKQIYYDPQLPDYPVVVLDKLPGASVQSQHLSTVDYTAIIDIVKEVQPRYDELTQYMTLEQRIDMDFRESKQRFETIKNHVSIAEEDGEIHDYMNELDTLREKITRNLQPRVLCHGDLDLRNVFQHESRFYFLDPEPVIAPIEFDIAKLMTMDTKLQPRAFGQDIDATLTWRIKLFYSKAWRLYYTVKNHFLDNFQA